ncbi:DUF302 domain-containing protein [Kitasatospora sp. NPDC017646]|uniref:DUF302 domain-containing protein n=1 Tax=Kitasatospora sp. NPDC017646 TaxID=3364024 RepID=UPI0037BD61C0
MDYGLGVRLDRPFQQVVADVTAALKEQGFGVLTTIDVRATLHEKLGEELEDYLILGACNPALAHRALQADRRIGLLLPCNVVVRRDDGATVVEAVDPQTLVTLAGSGGGLAEVADEAARRLSTALASLSA